MIDWRRCTMINVLKYQMVVFKDRSIIEFQLRSSHRCLLFPHHHQPQQQTNNSNQTKKKKDPRRSFPHSFKATDVFTWSKWLIWFESWLENLYKWNECVQQQQQKTRHSSKKTTTLSYVMFFGFFFYTKGKWWWAFFHFSHQSINTPTTTKEKYKEGKIGYYYSIQASAAIQQSWSRIFYQTNLKHTAKFWSLLPHLFCNLSSLPWTWCLSHPSRYS